MRYFPRGFVAATSLALVLGLPASASAGTQYQYDAFGRLIRVAYETGVVVQYSYDNAGNRTQVITGLPVANLGPLASNDAMSVPLSYPVDVQPPVAVNDTAYADTLTTISIPLLANDSDPDGQALTITSVTTPTRGTASIASGGGAVTYNAPSTAGTYTFQYTASDGAGGTTAATVSVVVQNIIIEEPGCLSGDGESMRPPPGCFLN